MQMFLDLPRIPLAILLALVAAVVLGLIFAGQIGFSWDPYDTWDELFGKRTKQHWTERQQTWVYNTTQGSQLIKYDWMLNLEQPDNEKPFLEDAHIEDLRYIPRGFDSSDPDRADHLPVGFVKDVVEDIVDGKKVKSEWLGFTCAACHTNEIEYTKDDGTTHKIRIDGGGTLANGALFISRLTQSIKQTVGDGNNQGKFNRFAEGVLGSSPSPDKIIELKAELENYLLFRQEYERRNTDSTTTVEGYGRMDAFGRIFNKALLVANGGRGDNFNPINAPVSYPFLWGTNQSDWVQWVGSTGNGSIGPLARNTGEVFGVFAIIDINPTPGTLGYPNSAKSFKQIDLEQRIRKLRSPVWDEEILGEIDTASAARGAKLFEDKVYPLEYKLDPSRNIVASCETCHKRVKRDKEDRQVVAWMEGIFFVKTDPATALHIAGPVPSEGTDPLDAGPYQRFGLTGQLQGRKTLPFFGSKLRRVESVSDILANEVAGILEQRKRALVKQEIIAKSQDRAGLSIEADKQGHFDQFNPLLAYKARSLNGIWATAPYLHNGSVPTLAQLLTKPEDRIKTFFVGSREFDPVNVGIRTDLEAPFGYVFRVRDDKNKPITGNSNSGHEYGTELKPKQKRDLIEYMKTEMAPNPK